MILETLPVVQMLSDEQKRQLAEELWDEVLPRGPLTADDGALLQLLEARYAEYQAQPESAAPWKEVRRRLNAARSCMKS